MLRTVILGPISYNVEFVLQLGRSNAVAQFSNLQDSTLQKLSTLDGIMVFSFSLDKRTLSHYANTPMYILHYFTAVKMMIFR